MLAAKGRPKVASTRPGGDRTNVTPEEYKAIASGVVANHGTSNVNEADKTSTIHPEAALFPNGEGREAKITIVSLEGDNLKTKNPSLGNAVWHRAR
jgi:hypothetical protein